MSTMLIPDPKLEVPPTITRDEVADLRWIARQAVDEVAFDLWAEGSVPNRYGAESLSHLMRVLEVVHLLGNEAEDYFPGAADENDWLNHRVRVLTPERIEFLLAEAHGLERRISWILFDDREDRHEADARSREEFYGGHMARARNARLTLERLCL
jgi:hypothetical protein